MTDHDIFQPDGEVLLYLAVGNETVMNCNALKMTAPDGKQRLIEKIEPAESAGDSYIR